MVDVSHQLKQVCVLHMCAAKRPRCGDFVACVSLMRAMLVTYAFASSALAAPTVFPTTEVIVMTQVIRGMSAVVMFMSPCIHNVCGVVS